MKTTLTLLLICNFLVFRDTTLLDTIQHNKRGDFNVICHNGKCDTVYCYNFYNAIKKQLKYEKKKHSDHGINVNWVWY